MFTRLIETPLFGLALSIFAFLAGKWVSVRTGSSLANPFAIAVILVILFLLGTGTPYSHFYHGGRMLTLFLGPATVSLAILIYRRRGVLREAALPIVVGCFVGSVVSVAGTWVGCWLLGLEDVVTMSLLPKAVTTPIAVSLSEQTGGLEGLVTVAVCVAGMTGALFGPLLLRGLGVENGIAQGLAMGVTSHAIGTSRAADMGELQAAISSIAIGVAGVITTILYLFMPAGAA